jgi:hypothetical protein
VQLAGLADEPHAVAAESHGQRVDVGRSAAGASVPTSVIWTP